MPPIIPAIIGLGLSAAGTIVSAVGQSKAGTAAQTAANYNAQVALDEAQVREDQQRTQDRAILAHNRAVIGTSGVTYSGSPLDVMVESARQAELNALNIRRAGRMQAQSDIYSGQQAKTASNFGVADTILGGTARVVNNIPTFGGQSSPNPGGGLNLFSKKAQSYSTVLG